MPFSVRQESVSHTQVVRFYLVNKHGSHVAWSVEIAMLAVPRDIPNKPFELPNDILDKLSWQFDLLVLG